MNISVSQKAALPSMASRPFSELPTERFRLQMRPHALAIYKRIFPGSRIEDLREQGVRVHVLDVEFGIDALWRFPDGQWITIQEKYRRNEHLRKYGDFTQEWKNAYGTQYESDGEWFKLAAQLYFYGWANETATGFAKWILLDVLRYKVIVQHAGGLNRIGKFQQNRQHGSAAFYAIPLVTLENAIILSSDRMPG